MPKNSADLPKARPIRVFFTGGGSGGHVVPNLAVIDQLRKLRPDIELGYVGSHAGPERQLVEPAGVEFFAIPVGKLRRYFSWANFADLFRFAAGCVRAWSLLRRYRPDLVFSKGGFVAVPVCIAAGWLGIPLIIHESDYSPGLATRIAARRATRICVSFAETARHFPESRVVLAGTPLRRLGNALKGRRFLRFRHSARPTILVVGGSLGAQFLNLLTAQILPRLTRHANLVWVTGAGKVARIDRSEFVRQFEFVQKEYPDILAACQLVIGRAGANSVFEFAAHGKPAVLIPLTAGQSRGDQVENAAYFARAGAAIAVPQEAVTDPDEFAEQIIQLLKDRERLRAMSAAARELAPRGAAAGIAKLILKTCAES